MILGICGAHRTGKTTLASEFAKRNGKFTFAATSVSKMMLAAGMDPARDYGIEQRIEMQQVILTELDKHYASFGPMTVFDRTPLDAAAYLLADVQRENVDPSLHPGIVSYVERAIEITNRRFSLLLFVPPALPLVEEAGKAPATPAYVEHISQIINGLRNDERMKVKHLMLRRQDTQLDIRVAALENSVMRLLQRTAVEAEEMLLNGIAVH
jgi:AAA domain